MAGFFNAHRCGHHHHRECYPKRHPGVSASAVGRMGGCAGAGRDWQPLQNRDKVFRSIRSFPPCPGTTSRAPSGLRMHAGVTSGGTDTNNLTGMGRKVKHVKTGEGLYGNAFQYPIICLQESQLFPCCAARRSQCFA